MQRLKIWGRNGDKAHLHNFSIRIGMSFILTLLQSDAEKAVNQVHAMKHKAESNITN